MAPSTPKASPRSADAAPATDNNDDLSLPIAVENAVDFLCRPLQTTYPPSTLAALSATLTSSLKTRISASTWETSAPNVGSGFRSLIAQPGILPKPMREAAKTHGVDPVEWLRAVGDCRKDEWELWIDPGCVSFRAGGWEWEDVGFEPNVKAGKRERCVTVWQAPSTLPQSAPRPTASTSTTTQITPARISRAIPIRAPTLFHIPPTPVPATVSDGADSEPRSPSPSLLPAFVQAMPPRAGSPAESQSSASSSDDQHSASSIQGRRHASNSSIASSISNNSQFSATLLTPGPRPGSADPFLVATHTGGSGKDATTPTTPTSGMSGKTATPGTATPAQTPGGSISVQRYDGVNVGVLGGGVKLGGCGGHSRPSSVRQPLGERSRSPSVSYPYSNPLSYGGAPASPRKSHFGGQAPNQMPSQRTRRRIMPTYLGSGIGGPQVPFGQGIGYAKLPNGYPTHMPRMSGF